jgi:hypothetical protein
LRFKGFLLASFSNRLTLDPYGAIKLQSCSREIFSTEQCMSKIKAFQSKICTARRLSLAFGLIRKAASTMMGGSPLSLWADHSMIECSQTEQ